MVVINDQILVVLPTTFSGWTCGTVSVLHEQHVIIYGLGYDVGVEQMVVPAMICIVAGFVSFRHRLTSARNAGRLSTIRGKFFPVKFIEPFLYATLLTGFSRIEAGCGCHVQRTRSFGHAWYQRVQVPYPDTSDCR